MCTLQYLFYFLANPLKPSRSIFRSEALIELHINNNNVVMPYPRLLSRYLRLCISSKLKEKENKVMVIVEEKYSVRFYLTGSSVKEEEDT